MQKKSKQGTHGIKTAVVLFAAFFASLGTMFLLAGNFLFNFALNPKAKITMKQFLNGDMDRESAERVWYRKHRKSVFIKGEDGLRLYGWNLRQAGHRYAILCHGYGGEPEEMAPYANKFYHMGYSVLMPAAQAHERSDGKYYGMGWKERRHVVRWAESIAAVDADAEIVLFGLSMGAATVMMAAGETLPDNVKCIIEDCGYSSVLEEFAVRLSYMIPVLNAPLLFLTDKLCRIRAGYGFSEASAAEQLKKAKLPMLFIHGEQDTFVPYAMLDLVYDACASKEKEKLSIPDAEHARAAMTNPKLYWGSIEKFLGRYIASVYR